jgi:hypothetical protein
MRNVKYVLGLLAAFGIIAGNAEAQFKNGSQPTELNIPRVSQRGTVSQRIGLTDITIAYHRPAVGGREIWGKTVPYGKVWRAGANENTTITFSDDVSVEGKPLAPRGKRATRVSLGRRQASNEEPPDDLRRPSGILG